MAKLALIAHDNKKADLLAWATYNRETLTRFALVATRHTAQLIRDKVGLLSEALLSGPEGGDAQIAARVATREVAAVFFFVDPLSALPHEPDVRALLQRAQRACGHQRGYRRPAPRRPQRGRASAAGGPGALTPAGACRPAVLRTGAATATFPAEETRS